MKKNMGGADRTIRFLVAAIIVALYYFEVIDGTLAIVLLVVAGIFVLTSFVSFCPIYTLLGINSCSIKRS
ncbi:DUF2892 domain-containing protein [Aequorivita sp. CIP111184]|uniref:YgaP family membrane protein n=1 Tax=Aequorivita sp. CIP111184 TaxID=2211356 RepID=UPI000DBBCBD0|nr:DUF2892 domain-containing protein [Aequorivita sp. CIP111184]SRX55115.1 hypothetical protein AEQU1_02136 [Aequorivita sp. CIP111184]